MVYATADCPMPSKRIRPRLPSWPPNPPEDSSVSLSERIEARLTELAALPPDWDDDGALPITRSALQVSSLLLAMRPQLAYLCELFPSPSGGVLMEYVRGVWDLSVEVCADGTLEIYGYEIGGTDRLLPKPFSTLNADFFKQLDEVGGVSWQ